jgi:hypothetical protein
MYSLVVTRQNVFNKDPLRLAPRWWRESALSSIRVQLWLAAHPRDQAQGCWRLDVGHLEVTNLFDGLGVLDQRWPNGTKATKDGVVNELHDRPHLLDGAETGFLVNTGKLLILVDAGLAWRRSAWGVAKQPPLGRQSTEGTAISGHQWHSPTNVVAKGRINHSGTDANEEQDHRFGRLPERSA